MTMPKILIVDDEKPIRRFLTAALASNYQTIEAASGEEAITISTIERPDLIILDIGLPGINGIEVTQKLREWSAVPIIVVSVREQEEDKIAALDAGADDYLTKPFSVGELMARIRVSLRRTVQTEPQPIFTLAGLEVDLSMRSVKLNGELVQLTPNEYDLLHLFIRHAGRVLTHRQLLTGVWGSAYEADTHVLQVNISNLRRKLEENPARPILIITEPGVGYRLRVP